MPAITNNISNSTGIVYEFSPGKTHELPLADHLVRQTCNLWAVGAVSSYLAPLAPLLKAVVDLSARCIPRLAPPSNVPGHQLSYVGKPMNWLWRNPVKATFISTVAAVTNSVAHLLTCFGEHMYTARSLIQFANESIASDFDKIFITNLKVKQALIKEHNLNLKDPFDLGSFARGFPSHFFVHSNIQYQDTVYRNVINDPDFSSVINNTNSSALEKQLDDLIYKYLEIAPINTKDEL